MTHQERFRTIVQHLEHFDAKALAASDCVPPLSEEVQWSLIRALGQVYGIALKAAIK